MTLDDLRSAFGIYPDLLKIAKSLHRLDEAACNYGLTPRQGQAVERLEKKAQDLIDIYSTDGMMIFHQSDPRGCSLYIVPKSFYTEGQAQDYTRDGIAII